MITCKECGIAKPEDQFYTSGTVRKSDGTKYKYKKCISCVSETRKERYYNRHHWLNTIKKENACTMCGDHRYWVLDFHHVAGEKKFSIGHNGHSHSKEEILAEIRKCIIICANCHRDLHFKKKQVLSPDIITKTVIS